jgi:uncharacterized protein
LVKPQTFEVWFATVCPDVPVSSTAPVLMLAGEGATVPFIARYRKEQTGNLDEVAVQKILDAKGRWDETLKRQAFIVGEIERQHKLTPDLKEKILTTFDPHALEDLYLPFKKKRKTKAAQAKEAGIEPLADWIWNCGHGTDKPLPNQTLEVYGRTFCNETAGYPDIDAVLQAAQDILTERLAEMLDLRQLVRDTYFKEGFLRTSKGDKAQSHSKFENYFDYAESVAALLQQKRHIAISRFAADGRRNNSSCRSARPRTTRRSTRDCLPPLRHVRAW